jgi:hypothetical protein
MHDAYIESKPAPIMNGLLFLRSPESTAFTIVDQKRALPSG